ncbi:MAG: thiamine pyrophosphate-dependent dehydrogenase E1 component subunit alpha [bacterium]
MKGYSKKFLLDLYKMMLKIRLAEESLVEPIIKGEIKTPCHLYSGEEAIAVGVCANLTKYDVVFGNHRSHGHYLAKGGDLNAMISEIYGKETGCCHGRGGSMHLIYPSVGFMGSTPIVAGTVSLATGAALAMKIRKMKNLVVSFFGDGATGEGVLYESMNFASLYKLPIIYVCENNFYATHLPLKEFRPDDNINEIAKPFKISSYRAIGNDVLSVYETVKKAVTEIKKERGPVFIEFRTYRLRGHVGPNDNIQGSQTDIRPKAEIKRWQKKDPLAVFHKYLIKNESIKNGEIEKIRTILEVEINIAHQFARKSSHPHVKDIDKYIFCLDKR